MSKNEPFAPWQCPLCGEKLTGDSTLKCTKGHCFDRAKEGYWHLLPVQSMRTKAPGDSKEMVAARRAFLNAGYYGIFGKAVGELCAEYGQPASPEAALHLLDAGCGEGWPWVMSRPLHPCQRLGTGGYAGPAGAAGGTAQGCQRDAGRANSGPCELPQKQPCFGHPAQ